MDMRLVDIETDIERIHTKKKKKQKYIPTSLPTSLPTCRARWLPT